MAKNPEIRQAVKMAHVAMRDLAESMNLSESALYYRLRGDLSDSLKAEILEHIQMLSAT